MSRILSGIFKFTDWTGCKTEIVNYCVSITNLCSIFDFVLTIYDRHLKFTDIQSPKIYATATHCTQLAAPKRPKYTHKKSALAGCSNDTNKRIRAQLTQTRALARNEPHSIVATQTHAYICMCSTHMGIIYSPYCVLAGWLAICVFVCCRNCLRA